MNHQTMSYVAILLKVGLTLVGIVVLYVLISISRRRHRIEQKKIDDGIMQRSLGNEE